VDGWLELLGALAGIAAVAALGSWFASGGANALAALVTPWREPGWPRGVQEDDDVRWDWRRPRDGAVATEGDLEAGARGRAGASAACERIVPVVRVRVGR